ncbi:MAG: ZIP family metal transporter [Pseudomonadota bacterium]
MPAAIQLPLLFGLLAAAVTSIGLIVVARRRDWSAEYANLFAVAAGGMLLTLVLVHIAPEAFERSSRAPLLIAIGFFGGLSISVIVRQLAAGPRSDSKATSADAVAPILAIAIHSFLDGIVYALTFAASFEAGMFAALALILHEFPEGVIAFAILRRCGVSNRNAFVFAFLAAAATTPLGVISSAPFVYGFAPDIVGELFAVSAGLLLFVALGPLLAPLRSQPPARGATALMLGVIFALGLTYSPLNSHRHTDTLGMNAVSEASLSASLRGGGRRIVRGVSDVGPDTYGWVEE